MWGIELATQGAPRRRSYIREWFLLFVNPASPQFRRFKEIHLVSGSTLQKALQNVSSTQVVPVPYRPFRVDWFLQLWLRSGTLPPVELVSLHAVDGEPRTDWLVAARRVLSLSNSFTSEFKPDEN